MDTDVSHQPDPTLENAEDAAALDALVDAGMDPSGLPEPLRRRAEHAAALLGLLGRGQSVGGRRLRIERVMAAVGSAVPAPDARLDELSDAALESFVMGGFRADRVPSSLASRAERHADLGRALTGAAAETDAWVRAGRGRRIDEALRTAASASTASIPFDGRGGRTGLRLADVIAAASILLLVSAVFVPALSAYRGAQQQVACASNMGIAGTALGMYSDDYRESLPMATAGFGGSWMDVGTTPERSNSANLFTLVRTGHAGLDTLACPGNERAPTRVIEPAAADWGSLEEVSYSYRIMSARFARVHAMDGRAVVMADRSPVILRAARGDAVLPEENSPNHGGEGQHLMRLDGSVQWATSPVVQGDNVWLPRPIERAIHTVRTRVGLVKGNELPSSPDDAFLGP